MFALKSKLCCQKQLQNQKDLRTNSDREDPDYISTQAGSSAPEVSPAVLETAVNTEPAHCLQKVWQVCKAVYRHAHRDSAKVVL